METKKQPARPAPGQAMVNGVDVAKLKETVEIIKANPPIASFRFRARNEWLDGGHSRATVKDFYGAGQEDGSRTREWTFEMDEPPVLLGHNHGANPVEYLLVGLSGCMTASMVYHAAARGIAIREVESRFEGDIDLHGFLDLRPGVRPGYQQIRVVFRIKADAPQEVLDELVELARRRSPVFDSLANPVPIEVRAEPLT